MSESSNIYNLEMHESMPASDDFNVVRVPGGWLYTNQWWPGPRAPLIMTTTFVPDRAENRPDKPND